MDATRPAILQSACVPFAGKTAADGLQWDALTTGEKAAGLFNVLRQNQGALEALSFLASIKPSSADDASTDVDWANVAAGFGSAAEELGVASSLSVVSKEVLRRLAARKPLSAGVLM